MWHVTWSAYSLLIELGLAVLPLALEAAFFGAMVHGTAKACEALLGRVSAF